VLAAISGARQGVLTALPAFVGVLLGAILGIKIAPLVVQYIESTPTRVAFAVAIFVLLVALGETLGVWLGRSLRERINSPKLAGVDNALGAIVQGAVDPFDRTPSKEVGPPDPALQSSAVVKRVRPSVLKIHAKAPSCSRALEGTGFVIAPERMMTNAHVVAGTNEVTVETRNGPYDARVVHYDPETDVAVLAVPGLPAPTLRFAGPPAQSGQDGIVLGYPLDGPYTASPARVRDRINLNGPDIYDSNTVTREVFTLRALVRSGNSGGPLVDTSGRVIGVIFGAAVDESETGFALTADEVSDEVRAAPGMSRAVGTGSCAA
jgi:S1-C subfamily serine protease